MLRHGLERRARDAFRQEMAQRTLHGDDRRASNINDKNVIIIIFFLVILLMSAQSASY